MSEVKQVEGQLTIIDGEGNEKLCQILFTVESEEFGKKYVVFYPIEDLNGDDDDKIALMAASYTEGEDGNGELSEVETEEEWSMLEDAVADYESQMDEGCHCDDCDGECDDEECDCDHEKCGCHHHEE